MTQIYEQIAANINQAYSEILTTLDEYKNETKAIEQLKLDTGLLKSESEALLTDTQKEIERKQKLDSELNTMLVSYNDLFQTKDNLVSHLNKIDQWIEDTLTSDKTLTELENELIEQEETLEENTDKAKVLIDKINTLDSMRNNLPRTEFRSRRSADDYDDNDENDIAYSDKNLLDSIKETIDNFEEDTESIDSQVKAMKFNDNFNSELEQIRNEINELKMTIAGTRDIANKINVAVNFSDTTFIHLRPSFSLKPALVTTGSFYIQTRAQFGPIVYIHNTSDPIQYISVHLQNGKPFFQYRLSEKSFTWVTTNVPINDGQWHKVIYILYLNE